MTQDLEGMGEKKEKKKKEKKGPASAKSPAAGSQLSS